MPNTNFITSGASAIGRNWQSFIQSRFVHWSQMTFAPDAYSVGRLRCWLTSRRELEKSHHHHQWSPSTVHLFDRCISNFLGSPTRPNAMRYGSVWHPCCFSELGNAHRAPLMFHHSIRAFITLLFGVCGPSTVLLAVSKFIFYAVDAVLVGWAMPHVLDKRLVAQPPFADRDVALGVFSGSQGFVAFGTRAHIRPETISSGATISVDDFSFGYFPPSAFSTAGALSCPEMVAGNQNSFSAPANALPSGVSSRPIAGSLNYEPRSESLSRNVFDVRVKNYSFILVLAHVMNGLSSSASQSLQRLIGAYYFTERCA